jgi:hypothetical protein
MKRFVLIIVVLLVFFLACSKNFEKNFIGNWEDRIIVKYNFIFDVGGVLRINYAEIGEIPKAKVFKYIVTDKQLIIEGDYIWVYDYTFNKDKTIVRLSLDEFPINNGIDRDVQFWSGFNLKKQ